MTTDADRIKRLVEDEDLQAAFANVRNAIHRKIDDVPIRDTEGLVSLRLMLHLLGSVEANLLKAIEDGTLEDFNAQEKVSFLGDLKWQRKQKNQ
jgi:hypothetical protein